MKNHHSKELSEKN